MVHKDNLELLVTQQVSKVLKDLRMGVQNRQMVLQGLKEMLVVHREPKVHLVDPKGHKVP